MKSRKPKPEGLGVGMLRADEAIGRLKLIPERDPMRERAFQHVADWIKQNWPRQSLHESRDYGLTSSSASDQSGERKQPD
jgi:hypothetical protein